ncbi:uncharacterized protein LOC132700037 isoform X2 [Cylas formicarius]|uniref:uncharacterized protein LOC132700037 isoform X2 n=1 Tax=Cylas formicarius TaxID=197179 RepID=UPI0029583737|nr:uncharacterized protein LOC132700037 isoform X2 [Cylas formicarius]
MEDTVSETTMSKTTSGEANKQPVEKPSRSVIAKNSGLKKCFSALVDRKQVNLDLEVLNLMLKRELQIPLNKLDPELATILPYMVVHYVKSWPGWQRSVEYYSGKTSFKAWYEKFYKYITLKLSQVVELHYGQAQAEIRKKRFELYAEKIATKKICNRNSQTDSLAPKGFAPFTIEVTGKPLLLNTIVFTDTSEGDILLKQHSVLDWDQNIAENITVRQIITWPNVGVHLSSPVFSFSRKNLHEIARHISVVGTALPNLHPKLIEEIGIIDQAEERQVYTLDYLRRMLTDLLAAFSCVIKSKPVIDAFQVIFDEFLADIEEINVLVNEKVTMASNTFVLFNIGGHLYFRNKKLSKGAPSRYDIGFTEMIIPKMQTALVSLSAPDKFRAYIDELKGLAACKENVQPNITFTCEYCSERYESIKTLACHLKDLHKMEQPMLCVSCKKSFSAFNLSKTRWSHACPKK